MVVALTAMALEAIMPMASTPAADIIYVSLENVASEESMRGLYESWYALYRRDDDPSDKEKWFTIFKAEARVVYKLDEDGASVKHHLNWFADMTQHEFAESFASCSPLEVGSPDKIKLNLHQPIQ
ncbi:hypothetical protein QYE76_031176 [Lolium multiflorum]|uniref:Cathepsin propeptide inhibitor domain-containing protein n=1 Tax=Lolium multiflorum TaxID=4521 RepID=A0AAD8VK20_LOLMU|nr:hypothetical protein QYE76_031176 [Lolium multiflorum]